MKVRFLALAALVLGMVSCQQDVDTVTPVSGEVDFQLSVDAKELATRAGDSDQNAMNSAFGAIDYLQGATKGDDRQDWDDVDLRYTLEVYDVADDYADATPVKDRQVIIVDEYQPVVFDLRLVPNRDYHFVVFADFVAQDATDNSAVAAQAEIGLHHVIGDNLGQITIKDDAINDESTDAYFATKDIRVSNSASQGIVLKRPYGKVRVIATDLAELNLNVDPTSVEVEYTAAHPSVFNAVTGEIDFESEVKTYTYDYAEISKESLADHIYTAGYDDKEKYNYTNANGDVRHSHMTLFTDYILAENQQSAIHFTMTVKDGDEIIKTTKFNTDIPVQRNYLTTVVGNVLTTATHIEVSIDDNFEGYEQLNLWNGKEVKKPAEEGEFYVIYEASQLAWLADQVNNKGQKFSGKTFKLGKNLHLNHELWTPIGATGEFQGTFDGNYNGVDHSIEGIFVSVKGKNFAGLFGKTKSATIKNLTILNSQVYGQYTAAAIVAHGVCARIENCHVEGCEVVSTPYNKDDANNVGGIVGYLSGETVAYVKGCSVKNSRITAYRKVAGIVGAANQTAEVSGNKVEGTTVVADMTAEYDGVKAADAGAIVGYKHTKATVKDNTIGANNSVIVLIDTDQERDESYAAKDEVIHVTFKAGEYDFSQNLTVNGAVQAKLGGKVTLNVDNNTITSGTPNHYGIIADGEGNELVINDANIISGGGAIAAANGGKVTINGGSAYVDTASTSGRYLIYTAGAGSEVVVNGGTYSWDPKDNQKRAYVYANAGTRVIINGGTFGKASTRSGYTAGILGTGEVIINAGTFGFDPTEWVAKGSTVKKVDKNWVVMAPEVATADDLAARLQENIKEIYVTLTEDIDVPISSLGTITGGSGEYKLGGEATEKITIDLNGKTLNITTTYWSNLGAKNANALFTIKNGTMTSSQATGTWNSYDLTFSNCDYVFENVKFAKAVAFDNAGKSVTMKNVTIEESHDYYAMWITATGQTVNIDGLTINSAGRGIKIDEQYVDAPAKVNLSVKNATFKTAKKAAILVKSVAGADIALENVDIANVAADTTNVVWVDEDAAAYADLVTVTGGNKKIENQ